MRAEVAIPDGAHAVSMLADLTKLFEAVTFAVLWREALPLLAVWLCLAMDGGRRRLEAFDSLKKSVSTSRGVTAVCAFAKTLVPVLRHKSGGENDGIVRACEFSCTHGRCRVAVDGKGSCQEMCTRD